MGGLSIFAHTDASVAPEATNVAILEPGSVPATPPGFFPTARFAAAMFAPGSDTISKALGNSKEVAEKHYLKPDGVLFAAAVCRFASLIDGLSRGFFRDVQFRKIVSADLASGQHRNPTNNSDYFTTAYFHRPEDFASEVGEAGFGNVQILSIEGPAWSAAQFLHAWNDPIQRQSLLDILSLIERKPSVQGSSAHLMAVARRPN